MAAGTLRMIRGSGSSAVTHYSCGTVEKAKRTGSNILIMKNGKQVAVKPRMVHRQDLLDTFCDTHPLAGEGKFIDLAAFKNRDTQVVVGAQHVNPYLRDQAYASIVEVLKRNIGLHTLAKLRAKVCSDFDNGTHLVWEGKRDQDGVLVASEWMTAQQIWDAAIELNPRLLTNLRQSHSHRSDVDSHKTAREKFFHDLDVLRRATCVVDVATGNREFCGGATPYSKPLEQIQAAIDKRFLTYGTRNGQEVAQYYYRLVFGRSEPHNLSKSRWAYEESDSKIAFRDERSQQRVAHLIG